jgi:hypothetical protein
MNECVLCFFMSLSIVNLCDVVVMVNMTDTTKYPEILLILHSLISIYLPLIGVYMI